MTAREAREDTVASDDGALIAGRFDVGRRLGRGSGGTVYLGRDRARDVSCAIKISTDAGEKATVRLEGEARMLAEMDHPNIVRWMHSGWLDDGRFYLVTEYVQGPTLARVVESGAVRLDDALTATAAIARGLSAVHRARCLHRDLKPENVIVPERDDRLRFDAAKLIDFGVFGRVTEVSAAGIPQTETGRASGTLQYMAPEQLAGHPQSIASDMYALGGILFELVFGHAPLEGEKAYSVSPDGGVPRFFYGPLVVKRLTEDVDLPPRTDLPPEIRQLMVRLLRRDPHLRPTSSLEIAETIDRLLSARAP